MNLDINKAKSRGISCDMSPSAVERRLEAVDELRELALELSRAQRLGPVEERREPDDSKPDANQNSTNAN